MRPGWVTGGFGRQRVRAHFAASFVLGAGFSAGCATAVEDDGYGWVMPGVDPSKVADSGSEPRGPDLGSPRVDASGDPQTGAGAVDAQGPQARKDAGAPDAETSAVDGGTPTDAGAGRDAATAADAGTFDASSSDAGKDAAVTVDSGPAPTGAILITEVMYDPSGTEPDQEWFELHNPAAQTADLSGAVLRDGAGRTHSIGALTIAAGEYVVLVRSRSAAAAAGVPSSAIAYEYGAGATSGQGVLLANGSTGGIAIVRGSTVLGEATFGGWFSQSSPGGKSVQLRAVSQPSNLASGWCLSANRWGASSDFGTPGLPSDCP